MALKSARFCARQKKRPPFEMRTIASTAARSVSQRSPSARQIMAWARSDLGALHDERSTERVSFALGGEAATAARARAPRRAGSVR